MIQLTPRAFETHFVTIREYLYKIQNTSLVSCPTQPTCFAHFASYIPSLPTTFLTGFVHKSKNSAVTQ